MLCRGEALWTCSLLKLSRSCWRRSASLHRWLLSCLETHRLSLLLRRGEVHMLSFVNSFRKCIPSLRTPSLVESRDSSWCDMFLHERLCMDVCGSLCFPLSLSQEKDGRQTVTERSTDPGLLFNMRILR